MRTRRTSSITSGLIGSLALVAAIVVAAWFILGMFGVHFALWSSLAISLALTAVLHLGVNAFRRQRLA